MKVSGTGENAVYRIQDCNSGKYLSVIDDSSAPNAGIEIRSYTGSSGQLFKIVKNYDGTFRILTSCSNYTKALYYTYTYSGGGIDYYKLDQYYYLSNDNTCRWYFENASNDRAKAGLGIPDGSYFISSNTNGQVAYYENNDYVKLKDYSELNENPSMLFCYQGKGYYMIKYYGRYLTANTSTSNNKAVCWNSSFTGTDKQLWEVSYNQNGNYYTIRSKNLAAAGLNYYLEKGGLFQGYKVCQGSTYSKEWRLIVDEYDKADVLMVGIIDSEHSNHSSWMGKTATDYYLNGLNSCMFDYQDDYSCYSSSEPLTDTITESGAKVVIIRGHGDGGPTETHMYLYDVSGTSDHPNLSSDDVVNCDFSDVEVILYIGCNTAYGYSSATSSNLLNCSVDGAGCMIAVGFTTTIRCSEANMMAEQFAAYYYEYLNEYYSNYSNMTPSSQQQARILSYRYAINSASHTRDLSSVCVYYYSGSYYTCS